MPDVPEAMSERERSLVERIARAFADVPVPADDELLHPDCRDSTSVEPYRGFARWQDVPAATLIMNYDGPSFFSAKAFRFFLPAFLTLTLERYRTSTDYVCDATVHELVPHTDYARSRYAELTPTECALVVEFLETMEASPEHTDTALARAALDGYWIEAALSDA